MVGAPGATAATTRVIVELVKLAWVSVLESVPLTLKVYVPAAVGVPLMTPALDSASPGGSEPLATVVEKVYGDWPPLAVRLWL